MITERTLRKWRKEALRAHSAWDRVEESLMYRKDMRETLSRILRLTQELLDQHLLRK